jgi:hypothetical protein
LGAEPSALGHARCTSPSADPGVMIATAETRVLTGGVIGNEIDEKPHVAHMGEARKIADAIVVRVHEAPDIDMVDHGIAPPLVCGCHAITPCGHTDLPPGAATCAPMAAPYERLPAHHETDVYWAMIIVMTRPLPEAPARPATGHLRFQAGSKGNAQGGDRCITWRTASGKRLDTTIIQTLHRCDPWLGATDKLIDFVLYGPHEPHSGQPKKRQTMG